MFTFLKSLWAKRLVQITKTTGDGEQVAVTFNERDDDRAIAAFHRWTKTFGDRMVEHNTNVLNLEKRLREQRSK